MSHPLKLTPLYNNTQPHKLRHTCRDGKSNSYSVTNPM